jgi:hypothetical protein
VRPRWDCGRAVSGEGYRFRKGLTMVKRKGKPGNTDALDVRPRCEGIEQGRPKVYGRPGNADALAVRPGWEGIG